MAVDPPSEPRDSEVSSDDSYQLDEQVGFLMRIANQRHTALFAEMMIEGLTPPQFATLAKLREIGPCSQNRLGRLVYLDAATIKGVVDRLSGRGFVMTADDPSDRRRRAIGLTTRGQSVADAAIDVAREITKATLVKLSPREKKQIVELLRKLG